MRKLLVLALIGAALYTNSAAAAAALEDAAKTNADNIAGLAPAGNTGGNNPQLLLFRNAFRVTADTQLADAGPLSGARIPASLGIADKLKDIGKKLSEIAAIGSIKEKVNKDKVVALVNAIEEQLGFVQTKLNA
jgi:hypothetical protein